MRELVEPVLGDEFAAAAGRPGSPDDVAAAVALLIESTYVTGAVAPV
jgi:NAD(P)-dependent dehydrogenase (short-subunit alcohol dehydrogenase family)